MKILFSLLLGLCLLGCTEIRPAKAGPVLSVQDLNPDSSSTDWVTGLIETGGTNIYFVLNWESKSRESYLVLNAGSFDLKAGKIHKLQGELTHQSRWSGTIKILQISQAADSKK